LLLRYRYFRRSQHVLAALFGAGAAFASACADQVALKVRLSAQYGNHKRKVKRTNRRRTNLPNLCRTYNSFKQRKLLANLLK
jgi:uncharacterized membrane protein YciS (DUF1049 family)